MDNDLLEISNERILKSILSQDVTGYTDLVSQDVILNILYDERTLPLPSQETNKRGATAVEDAPVQGSHKGGEAAASGPDLTSAAAQLAAAHDASPTCTVCTGSKSFAEATYVLYQWLQQGKAIAQPLAVMEPRRPRKDPNASSPSSKMPASPRGGAKNVANAPVPFKAFQVGSQVERNAKLMGYSRIIITWGRTNLQIRDEVYFDEGQVFIVDRSLVVPDDLTNPQYLADRASFYKESLHRVDTNGNHPPVLDFTFQDVHDVVDLLRVKPAHGRYHKIRGVEVAAARVEKAVNAAAVFQLAGQKQAAPNGKTLIKAKNKKGEEEAYEIADDRTSKVIKAEKEVSDDVVARLGEMLEHKYEAHAFRLSNNPEIRDIRQLIPVLRTLIANSFLTITWLDLSCNAIVHLPADLVALPLQSLYLHGNLINDWAEVDNVVVPIVTLTSVTMHGTPLAQQPNYKFELMSRLMTAPQREIPLKQIDFVPVSTQDIVVGSMQEAFKKKKSSDKVATARSAAMRELASQSMASKNPRVVTPRSRARGPSMSPRQVPPSPRR
jgi:hypothetical protein